MQTKEFSNEQTMLTLAMASYAGFFDTGTNRMVEATLSSILCECFSKQVDSSSRY